MIVLLLSLLVTTALAALLIFQDREEELSKKRDANTRAQVARRTARSRIPTRSVLLVTEPPGAMVYMGKIAQGRTPHRQAVRGTKKFSLRFELKGYKPKKHTINPSLVPRNGNVLEQRLILVPKPKVVLKPDAGIMPPEPIENMPAVVQRQTQASGKRARPQTVKTQPKVPSKVEKTTKVLPVKPASDTETPTAKPVPKVAKPPKKPRKAAGKPGRKIKKKPGKRRKARPKTKSKNTEFENPF